MWHKNYSDGYLPGYWADRLRESFPVLALTIEARRRGAGKQELVYDDDLSPRKAYMKEVLTQFEADPESVNPFDNVALLLLYHHYKNLVHAGIYYVSLHNLSMLVALHLKIRHGIFRTNQAMADVDSIISARFSDKLGKLKKMLEQKWQSLTIDMDTLIVSADFKRFEKSMRRAYFLRLQYVMFVSSLPYFPNLVVEAKLVLPGKRKVRDVLLGAGREAVLVIDEKSNQTTEQFAYSRILSWAFSKEMFSFRYVSERGASRKGAEEIIFITPDAQLLSDAVSKQVDQLVLLETPWAEALADKRAKIPKIIDEYMQLALQMAKGGGSGGTAKTSSSLDHSQEKRLRNLSAICGSIAEMSRIRISAGRTKQNFEETLEMKKRTMALLTAASKLDAALRLVGKGTSLDVTTTVRLTGSMKLFVQSVEMLAGEAVDAAWRQKMEAIVKRVEEN